MILILSTFPTVAQDTDEEDDEVDYIQMKVDSILSLITKDTPDSSKEKSYRYIGEFSDNYDTAIKYASLSLEYCKDTDCVLITADCTGHGIPGAFLSMLGISALKEYCVTENDAANPGIILDHMRESIKTTLVSSTKKTIDDGMDMTICSYDFDAMEMRYAAANQSAYIIRRGEAIRLKGDRMPVGRYIIDDQHFATHIQPIEHGDMIYTFSDGIQDQPGGELDNPLGRKFLTKNLVKLLTEIAQKPLNEQRDIIDNTITKWRNGRPQVDDITMIGLRIQGFRHFQYNRNIF